MDRADYVFEITTATAITLVELLTVLVKIEQPQQKQIAEIGLKYEDEMHKIGEMAKQELE